MSKTRTQVTIRTRTEADVALRRVGLDDAQERVLRMRYGIALDPTAELEQRGQVNEATQAALQQIEQRVLAHLAEGTGVDAHRRAAVIDRLRKL